MNIGTKLHHTSHIATARSIVRDLHVESKARMILQDAEFHAFCQMVRKVRVTSYYRMVTDVHVHVYVCLLCHKLQ